MSCDWSALRTNAPNSLFQAGTGGGFGRDATGRRAGIGLDGARRSETRVGKSCWPGSGATMARAWNASRLAATCLQSPPIGQLHEVRDTSLPDASSSSQTEVTYGSFRVPRTVPTSRCWSGRHSTRFTRPTRWYSSPRAYAPASTEARIVRALMCGSEVSATVPVSPMVPPRALLLTGCGRRVATVPSRPPVAARREARRRASGTSARPGPAPAGPRRHPAGAPGSVETPSGADGGDPGLQPQGGSNL